MHEADGILDVVVYLNEYIVDLLFGLDEYLKRRIVGS